MPETVATTLTTRQAANRLGLSPATVNRLIKAGELLAIKKTTVTGQPARNSPYLIYVNSVVSYEQRRQHGA
jgi:excisionase family DNA binding protein